MNLPNALTLLRILLIPAFAWAYFERAPVLALWLYLAACFTDFLDGYLARKLNQITNFGKLFDPLADKLMLVTLLFCLAYTGHVAWWVLGVIALKELYMLAGSLYMLKRDVVVSSNLYGKVATFVFIVALALVFPWHNQYLLTGVGTWLLWIAVGLSLLSMAMYTVGAIKTLRETARDC